MCKARPSQALSPELLQVHAPKVHGANDNAIPGEACVTDAGAALPVEELSDTELLVLTPLINALARLAAKRLSATTISSEAP